RLELPRRRRGDPDHVPLLQLDDVVVDLHASAAGDDDVRLLLLLVPVAEALPEVRRELLVAEPELAELERLASEAGLHPLDPELRRRVVDVGLQVLNRVIAHRVILTHPTGSVIS